MTKVISHKIQSLIDQAGTDSSGKWLSLEQAEKLVNLVLSTCGEMNREQSYELMGAIEDISELGECDGTSMHTLREIQSYLNHNTMYKYFNEVIYE